jgi:hypothetical protein
MTENDLVQQFNALVFNKTDDVERSLFVSVYGEHKLGGPVKLLEAACATSGRHWWFAPALKDIAVEHKTLDADYLSISRFTACTDKRGLPIVLAKAFAATGRDWPAPVETKVGAKQRWRLRVTAVDLSALHLCMLQTPLVYACDGTAVWLWTPADGVVPAADDVNARLGTTGVRILDTRDDGKTLQLEGCTSQFDKVRQRGDTVPCSVTVDLETSDAVYAYCTGLLKPGSLTDAATGHVFEHVDVAA